MTTNDGVVLRRMIQKTGDRGLPLWHHPSTNGEIRECLDDGWLDVNGWEPVMELARAATPAPSEPAAEPRIGSISDTDFEESAKAYAEQVRKKSDKDRILREAFPLPSDVEQAAMEVAGNVLTPEKLLSDLEWLLVEAKRRRMTTARISPRYLEAIIATIASQQQEQVTDLQVEREGDGDEIRRLRQQVEAARLFVVKHHGSSPTLARDDHSQNCPWCKVEKILHGKPNFNNVD